MNKPLKQNRILFTWMCVHPAGESTSIGWRCAHEVFAFAVFMLNLTAAIATLSFVLKNRSDDLEDDFYALAITICFFAANVAMILEYHFRHSVIGIFEHLTEVYNAVAADEECFRYLIQANDKNTLIFTCTWKYLVGCGTYGMFFCIFGITHAVSIYSSGRFDRNRVFILYAYVLPWDQSTPLGYWAEFLYSAASGVAYLIAFYSMSLLFIGVVLHFGAFNKIYKHWFSQLGASVSNHEDSQLLCKLIKFNIKAKKLFFKTSDMFLMIGTIQLLHGMVLLAVFLFKAVEEFKSFDMTLLSPLPSMANCICCVYLYTYCGNETNDSFADISELLYQFDWFKQPQHVQKTLLLVMQNAQQEMFYSTFGGFPLNMDTFGRFAKTCYNYFMVCRTLAAKEG